MMTRRSFWSKVLGGLSVGVGAFVVCPTRVSGSRPPVSQGEIVPMYFIDWYDGEDHSGFPYQDCPHKTLDFMNKDSKRHRQWILYVRQGNNNDPQYAEAWESHFGPTIWAEMR